MTSPYIRNWSDDPDADEPVEPLGPRARSLAEQRVAEFEEWFLQKFGYPLGEGPRQRMHPDQWEAEQRQAEKAERDAHFRRIYGDGR
jgi:glutathione S-transferase